MKYIQPAPSAVSTCADVAAGRLSVVEVAQATLARIEALEPHVHAWQALDPAFVMRQAETLDAQRQAGGAVPALAGLPLAVKDIFDTADLPTGYGSPIYRQHQPAVDAAVVRQVRQAGALVVGKTVTTEFAYFTPGPTANPWHVSHTPGGSSSGSAAAVASGMVPLAFGSQTAGSLIRPASYCGVFALKPTYGTVDLQGAKPFSHSLDTFGWMARDADDLELLRCALAGVPYVPLKVSPLSRLRLSASRTHEATHLDAGGQLTWDTGLDRLTAAGLSLRHLDLPDSLAGLCEAQKTVMAWEAARSLERERRECADQLSPAIRALLDTGDSMPESRYREAQALAEAGGQQVAVLMEGLDALVVPAAPGEAPAGLAATGDPVFSRVWTLLGLPCVNVPGLLGPSGLPVGLQLVGHPHQERRLLSVAAAVHSALTFPAA